ncbi:hypothetical protein DS2_04965 [Catenovulum agarivorans DS-2]|uniref:Citrate synthase n=1 Tax=Catenovulum agarivorans DS-2 TaxID=1328313 RepID=W7R0N7_9ALTE|nr:hypothetical protein [Catenovulum agarivorans]EWH11180.1 hypothetical protein DS2_04965 [Catenovulum agarivorans DS-2]
MSQSFNYAKKLSTKIWYEVADEQNPFVAKENYLFGYPYEQLLAKKSYLEMLYLLFTGNLPNSEQKQLLQILFKGLMNFGPRDSATRASMLAGIGKSSPEHILPTGLLAMGGTYGAAEVEHAYLLIEKMAKVEPKEAADSLLHSMTADSPRVAPGFGSIYGEIDARTHSLLLKLIELSPDSKIFQWTEMLCQQLHKHNFGIVPTGLTAVVCLKLGIGARESIGLYQLARAPGLLAHGMEQTHKPLTAMPLLEDENYVLRKEE